MLLGWSLVPQPGLSVLQQESGTFVPSLSRPRRQSLVLQHQKAFDC
jgi:hypothetical protein